MRTDIISEISCPIHPNEHSGLKYHFVAVERKQLAHFILFHFTYTTPTPSFIR
jgi:hypothetical protein